MKYNKYNNCQERGSTSRFMTSKVICNKMKMHERGKQLNWVH